MVTRAGPNSHVHGLFKLSEMGKKWKPFRTSVANDHFEIHPLERTRFLRLWLYPTFKNEVCYTHFDPNEGGVVVHLVYRTKALEMEKN